MRVTVLGTGIMGSGMARSLLRAGHDVTVWNRTESRAAALGDDGARVAESPQDAVTQAEAVVTMLADGSATEELMTEDGVLAAFPEGCVWIQMATVGVESAERLVELAAEAGVVFVDAPVLGSRGPAEAGELTVLASGPEEALDRATPVFDAVGKTTRRLGAAGSGSRFKLVLNAWIVLLNSGMAEVLTVARALGFSGDDVLGAIEGGPLDAPYARTKAQLMMAGDFEPSFPLKHALKDARLVLAATERDLGLIEAAAAQMDRADAFGHGDEDMAATICALAEIPARAD